MTATNPTKLGRYEVLEELGRGAMGVVFLARDPVIHRLVALKTFRTGPELEARERKIFRERFLMEARSCGRLNHPNIVTIHDVVEMAEDDAAFMAMEYVRGTNLKVQMRRGKLEELSAVAAIVRQVASALDYAHAAEVVHRDVKPANILLTEDGQAKLTDFGIARLNTSNLTHDGQLIGTPNYMSPEQIRGRSVDHRTDIFSFGVVLYEMLTHQKPFQADNLTAVTYRIVNEPFQPIRSVLGALPEGVVKVLERALAKDPEERYASAGEVAKDLDAALAAGSPVSGSPAISPAAHDDTEAHEDTEAQEDTESREDTETGADTETRADTESMGSGSGGDEGSRREEGEGWKDRLDGVLNQSIGFLDRTIPPEARPPRRRVALYGILGVVVLMVGLVAAQLVRGSLQPGAMEEAAEDRLRWSNQVSELMVAGARQLDSGDVQSALGAFQQAGQVLDRRRTDLEVERTAAVQEGKGDKAEVLAEEAADLADREEAVRIALLSSEWRREELYAQEVATAGVEAALGKAREAADRRNTRGVLHWARQALALDPTQEEAQALVSNAEARLSRARRPEIPVAPPPPVVATPKEVTERVEIAKVEEEEAVPVPTTARLVLDFVSDLPKGVLLLYLDEEQILRENFRFVESGGLFRRQKARTGRLEKSFTVSAGLHTLRVYVSGARNRPTEVKTLEVDFPPGGSKKLTVKVDDKGRVETGTR